MSTLLVSWTTDNSFFWRMDGEGKRRDWRWEAVWDYLTGGGITWCHVIHPTMRLWAPYLSAGPLTTRSFEALPDLSSISARTADDANQWRKYRMYWNGRRGEKKRLKVRGCLGLSNPLTTRSFEALPDLSSISARTAVCLHFCAEKTLHLKWTERGKEETEGERLSGTI
jgi:hypothetical protein